MFCTNVGRGIECPSRNAKERCFLGQPHQVAGCGQQLASEVGPSVDHQSHADASVNQADDFTPPRPLPGVWVLAPVPEGLDERPNLGARRVAEPTGR
jgi:hypothetical protein